MAAYPVLFGLAAGLLGFAALCGLAAVFVRRWRLELLFTAAFALGGFTGLGWAVIFGFLP